MKPLLLLLLIAVTCGNASAQSADYLSVRKKNGHVIKNFFSGGYIQLITKDNSYIEGPVVAVRADSLFIVLYDVRTYRGAYSTMQDTISSQLVGLHYKDIGHIALNRKESGFQRLVPPLMMIAGVGYVTLNVINGAIQNQPVFKGKNLRRLGTAAGLFGIGYLLNKLFTSDGFTKARHQIVYVDL